jgi:hypothetical protein
MKKGLFNKVLVFGIIFIFAGSGIVAAIDSAINKEEISDYCLIDENKKFTDKFFNIFHNLEVTITTDKTTYKRLEPIKVTISVTNNGEQDWHFRFPDSQIVDFDIEGYYKWSRDKMFFQMVLPITIKSGETIVILSENWYQYTNWYKDGIIIRVPIPPGHYTMRGWMPFLDFPIPPIGYTDITIEKYLTKSAQTNNILDFISQKSPIFERLLGLISLN